MQKNAVVVAAFCLAHKVFAILDSTK